VRIGQGPRDPRKGIIGAIEAYLFSSPMQQSGLCQNLSRSVDFSHPRLFYEPLIIFLLESKKASEDAQTRDYRY